MVRNKQSKAQGIKPIPAASPRRAKRMQVANEFFAVSPGRNTLAKGGGWLPPGVYKREGAGGHTLRQYLKFVRKAGYRKRLDVEAEAAAAVKANVQRRWDDTVKLIA